MNKRIKDIFRPEIFAVPPDIPATVVMDIMRDKNISCIVVTERDKAVGIYTERDVVRCMARPEADHTGSTIEAVMTRDVHSVTPETMVYEAFSMLTEKRIRHLVVVDHHGKALGVITQSDLLDHFEYDYLEKGHTVGQIMNKRIVTADPYDTVCRTARAMADGSLSFLIVCRQLQPLGVITERDMAGFAAEGMDIDNTVVEEVMSTPVHTVGAEQPAFKAVARMHEFGIRHLVVVNDAGKVIGVLTQTDLIRGLEKTFSHTLRVVAREQGAELAQVGHRLAEKTLCLDAVINSAISVGIAITDRELLVTHLTPSAEFMLGVTAEEVLGKNIRTLIAHQNIPYGRFDQAIARIGNRDTYTFTMQRRENKLARIIQATLSGIFDNDTLAGCLLLLDDITDRRITEETMHRLAYYDALTGLANRSMFDDRLKSELARSRRTDAPFALILLDLDDFQSVNATLSRQAGDRLLREVARRLDGLLRESDTVARLGSDEFGIILVGTATTGDLQTVASKIIRRLSPAYELDTTTLAVSFSLGAVLFPVHGEDEETLLRNAAAAMGQAKKQGKGNGASNIVVA